MTAVQNIAANLDTYLADAIAARQTSLGVDEDATRNTLALALGYAATFGAARAVLVPALTELAKHNPQYAELLAKNFEHFAPPSK